MIQHRLLSAKSLTPVFKSNPDYYGRFGHQTNCFMTSLILSNIFNGKFVNWSYRFAARQFNNTIDLMTHPRVFKNGYISHTVDIQSLKSWKDNRSRFELTTLRDCKHLFESISLVLNETASSSPMAEPKYVVVDLPYDLHPGLLFKYLSLPKTRQILSLCRMPTYDTTYDLAFHLRGDDVTSDGQHCWMHVDTSLVDLFVKLISNSDLIHSNIINRIGLCSQEPVDVHRIQLYKSLLPAIHIDVFDRCNDLHGVLAMNCMMNSRLVVSGGSSFPFYCSYLANNKQICLINDINCAEHHRHFTHAAIVPCSTEGVYNAIHSICSAQ